MREARTRATAWPLRTTRRARSSPRPGHSRRHFSSLPPRSWAAWKPRWAARAWAPWPPCEERRWPGAEWSAEGRQRAASSAEARPPGMVPPQAPWPQLLPSRWRRAADSTVRQRARAKATLPQARSRSRMDPPAQRPPPGPGATAPREPWEPLGWSQGRAQPFLAQGTGGSGDGSRTSRPPGWPRGARGRRCACSFAVGAAPPRPDPSCACAWSERPARAESQPAAELRSFAAFAASSRGLRTPRARAHR